MTPNIQLKSEKLKQSSRCFVCLMPNILMISITQMFGIRQINIQNLDTSRWFVLYRHSLGPLGVKPKNLVIIDPDCYRNCESHKTFVRVRLFCLKSEKSLETNTQVNGALLEEPCKEKYNMSHCSSNDFASLSQWAPSIPQVLEKRQQRA